MSSVPQRAVVYDASTADFYGVPVTLLTRERQDAPSAVAYDSVAAALPSRRPYEQDLLFRLRGKAVSALMRSPGGGVQSVRLIELEAFFRFAQTYPSPELDRFRDFLARVAVRIHEAGGYAPPGGEFTAPEDVEDDPQVQAIKAAGNALARAIRAERLAQATARRQEELGAELQAVRESIGRGPTYWLVSQWLAFHDVKVDAKTLQDEGMVCRQVCLRLGISIPEKLANGPGEFPARKWPIEVIREWWPDFCRRRGLDVFWRI